MEVRRHGSGSVIPLDLHNGLRDGHVLNHSASACSLRHDETHRYPILEDCQEENADDDDGPGRGLNPGRYRTSASRVDLYTYIDEIFVNA